MKTLLTGGNGSVLLFYIFIASVEQEVLFNEQLVNPKHKQDKHKHKQDKHKQTIVGTIDPRENSSTLYFIIVIFSIHSIIYMKASSALKVEIRSTISRITWIITLPTVNLTCFGSFEDNRNLLLVCLCLLVLKCHILKKLDSS